MPSGEDRRTLIKLGHNINDNWLLQAEKMSQRIKEWIQMSSEDISIIILVCDQATTLRPPAAGCSVALYQGPPLMTS